MSVRVEICVEDVDGALSAERCGADRIELCADLSCGGLTPPIHLVAEALERMRSCGVQVLVRSRPGDFVYDNAEASRMLRDITAMRSLPRPHGVRLGFVLSGLTAEGTVAAPLLRELLAACADAPTTFSRAFDEIDDQRAALDTLLELGVTRVLTSGGRPTAAEGADRLHALVTQSQERIGILAAGGVRSTNVAHLVARTGVREVHQRAPHPDGRTGTSVEEIRATLAAIGRTARSSDLT